MRDLMTTPHAAHRRWNISQWAWAPFLITGYAVIFLYEHNIDRVTDIEVVYALAAALAGVGVLVGIGRLVLRDTCKAALAASVGAITLFSIGHVWNLLKSQNTTLSSQFVLISG